MSTPIVQVIQPDAPHASCRKQTLSDRRAALCLTFPTYPVIEPPLASPEFVISSHRTFCLLVSGMSDEHGFFLVWSAMFVFRFRFSSDVFRD